MFASCSRLASPRWLAFGLLALVFTLANSGSRLPADEGKIDPAVRRALANGREAAVLLLAKTQLLNDGQAYGKFCRDNASRKRSSLRKETIERLKKIADDEQPRILAALGQPGDARRLWLVNAVAASLSAEQIEKAARLDLVKYVYPAGRLPDESGPAGTVAEVLKPQRREPFSAKDKRVGWNVEMVNASRVWEKFQVTGEGVVVAMFDTGVNYRHQDLRRNIWINKNEIPNNGQDDDGNGLVDDYYGFDFIQMKAEVLLGGARPHGTWTAGIVAGDGSGGTVTGVAPRAQLMILRGMGGGYLASRAFQYCLEHGADIVNMSFSVPNLGNTRGYWRLMCEQASCAGLVSVSGAGNFQQSAQTPVQLRVPEGIPCVIAAGGVDKQLEVPPFCSLGPVEWGSVRFYEDYPLPQGLVKPDVCGFPGAGYPILSTGDEGYIDPNRRVRGNSFSSPHVAGVSALVLSAAPELPAWKVKEILEETATDIDPQGKDNRTGAGLLNAYKAVKAARALAGDAPTAATK